MFRHAKATICALRGRANFRSPIPVRHALPLLAAALTLSACSPPGAPATKPDEDPKFAGLDQQILAWRADIEKTNPVCTAAKGCQDYDVACKGERPVTPQDQARGITAKVVVAMTFNPKAAANAKPGSAFAEFTKAAKGWTRGETAAVNLSSCAGF